MKAKVIIAANTLADSFLPISVVAGMMLGTIASVLASIGKA